MIKRTVWVLISAALFLGCEEPPVVKKSAPQSLSGPTLVSSSSNTEANSLIPAPPRGPSQGRELPSERVVSNQNGKKISFNEDAASAMKKVREMMASNNAANLETEEETIVRADGKVFPTPPPEIKAALEEARNDKTTTDIINSVLSDLPEQKTSSDSMPTQDNLALGTNEAGITVNSNSNRGTGTFGAGVRVPSKTSVSADSSSNKTSPSPSPSPSPTEPPVVKGARPRGYLMLYMPHPRAREVVEVQIQNLIDANIENVFVGLLTDGTFGRDFSYVKSALNQLSAAGRVVTLATYVSNGATMRSFNRTPITAGFSRVEPIEFRELIENDPSTRSKYLSLAKDAAALLAYNSSLNSKNINIAIPMLEDNLTKSSYLAVRGLLKEALTGISATIVRNPCLGCYSGNDADSAGDPIDEHGTAAFHKVKFGDSFSFDGAQYLYPGEVNSGLPFDAALGLIAEAERRGALFVGLWRNNWQGLANGPMVHPDRRNYIAPTTEESAWDIKLLRAGLE